MFVGHTLNKLDEKYRLTVPARFREELTDGAYVLPGFDRCLMILTPVIFEAMARKVDATSITDPESRFLRRMFFASAEKVELDKAGRILVSESLRGYAGITNEAWVIGSGRYLEIWSPEGWEPMLEVLSDSEANAQRFVSLNLSTEL